MTPELAAAVRRLYAASAIADRFAIPADTPAGFYMLQGDPAAARIRVRDVRELRDARAALEREWGRADLADDR